MKYTVKKKNIYYTVGRYRLDNKQDAEHLCHTLNQYYNTQEIIQQYDKINRQLIQINLTLGILTEELHTLNKMVKQ